MQIFEVSASKKEQQKDQIGKVECTENSLVDICIGLLSSVGMINPGQVVAHSSKGVKLTRKGDKYILTLLMFKPPLHVTWSASHNYDKLPKLLVKASKSNETLCYISIINPADKSKLVQLAFAN